MNIFYPRICVDSFQKSFCEFCNFPSISYEDFLPIFPGSLGVHQFLEVFSQYESDIIDWYMCQTSPIRRDLCRRQILRQNFHFLKSVFLSVRNSYRTNSNSVSRIIWFSLQICYFELHECYFHTSKCLRFTKLLK